MKVEYRKDLHHNYMVLTEEDTITSEAYSKKMLELQTIDGLLSMEQRRLDGSVLLFYDITAKQALSLVTEKTLLSFETLKKLIKGILEAIEGAYECLLAEDDIILQPDFIYLDVSTAKPYLCYYSGYRKNIFAQVSSLLEYLMNKVDYKDKEAVMLVYRLYAVTREDGYTFDRLLEALHTLPENFSSDKPQSNPHAKDTRDMIVKKEFEGEAKKEAKEWEKKKTREGLKADLRSSSIEPMKSSSKSWEANIPIMVEKLEDEEEKAFYPLITFVYTGLCILGGILLLTLSFTTGILYNAYGERIDYNKLFALFLILFSAEAYLLRKIWDKRNKITKLVTRKHYVDPRKDFSDLPEEEYKPGSTVFDLFPKGISRIFKKQFLPKAKRAFGQREDRHDELHRYNKVRGYRSNTSSNTTSEYRDVISLHDETDHNNADHNRTDRNKAVHNKAGDHNIATNYLTATDYKETDYFDDTDDDVNPTCILNAEVETKILTLKPQDENNYKPIVVKEFPFFIGKLKKNVDYCLENDMVSRYHAKITKEQDQYFITDLNSMNGTFVNQEPVLTYDKKEIKPGDTITFANISYVLTE